MPKVTVRKDGTWYTQAVVTPGSNLVRTWEVKREGVEWLQRRGIQVGHEMGRSVFHELLKLGYAYIANTPRAKGKASAISTSTRPPQARRQVPGRLD